MVYKRFTRMEEVLLLLVKNEGILLTKCKDRPIGKLNSDALKKLNIV